MKISNETKVGALTIISVALLVLGFDLLKGKSVFSSQQTIYAIYSNVSGLSAANSVQINGLKVGNVSSLNVMDKHVGQILVKLDINKNIDIPRNSVASIISSDLLGTKAVRIDFGNTQEYLHSGDTILSAVEEPITESLTKQIKPLSSKMQSTLSALDSVLMSVHQILDKRTRDNLKEGIASLKSTFQNLSNTSAEVTETMKHIKVITANLSDNNDNMDSIFQNAKVASHNLATTDFKGTIQQLQDAVSGINNIIDTINSNNGSLGLLLHDQKLYYGLQESSINLNKLLMDLRLNPKKYVHFSLFGGKVNPRPLPKDSLLQ